MLRGAFGGRGGVEVDTQGDAFLCAFADAGDAAAAAGEAREALRPGPIHVRIGIHTGEPYLTEEGYVGDVVHLGAADRRGRPRRDRCCSPRRRACLPASATTPCSTSASTG